MNFEMKAFLPSQQQVLKKFGLEENGRVQKVIDTSFIHYMKLKMPQDSGMMISNTRNPEPGLVTVETPYAHYMNEGILYLTMDGRSWAHKDEPKYPTEKLLNYHGGPDRGAHFVERTASENIIDIAIEARKEMNKR
jgi:hypothetical protein|nr:MAG TPA: Minor capsid protein [Caudoviricetes sp.]